MVDVQNTPINTAATRLPSVGLCGVLAQSVFHLVDPLKKHLGGNSSTSRCLKVVPLTMHKILR